MKIVILVIAGVILFMSFLGLRGLCEPDEGRYAEIGREMTESGDWLTPQLNYLKHFHKPPLVYWLVASSFSCFRINEFFARFPIALFGILGLIVTYLLALRLGEDKKSALFSGLVLATTMQYFVWTQVLSSDLVFSFFILWAFYGFWARNIVFYLGMALAFMVKGPVAVILAVLVVLPYIFITKEYSFFSRRRTLGGIILFLAIVSPWFYYVCSKNPGLAKYFVFYQSLDRLFSEVHGRGQSIFYYIPVFLIGALPWLVFIPGTFKERNNKNLFIALWIIIPIIFFSFSRSKLPGYILPIYPALAIAAGTFLAKKKSHKLFLTIFLMTGIVFLTGVTVSARYEEKLGSNLSIRQPAGIIQKDGSFEDMVINYRCFLQGLPFYLRKRIILAEKERETKFETDQDLLTQYLIPRMDIFLENLKGDKTVWCFTRVKDYQDLQNDSTFGWYEVWQGSKYLLVTNKQGINHKQN